MEKPDIRSHLDSIRCEMVHAQHGYWRHIAEAIILEEISLIQWI